MSTGLRRFARPAPVPAAAGAPGAPKPDAPERCEMCATELDPRHGHVADLEKRSIVCTCRACYLLFTASGAAKGRYQALPEEVFADSEHTLTGADWDALQVPVGTAFFFVNSDIGRVVGCYPSPAGATECELDLDEWARLAAEHPMLGALTPDVQAIFANKGEHGIEAFLVPIDMCYAFVGRIRMTWSGLDGGEESRTALRDFVDHLRERARQFEVES